ncbi:MAG: hypothetical protein K0V04_13770 [Deltaproteobacteria bacterium]|nr:hypothetical protein [Deltaproteobacteria bacterium]
MPYRLPSAHNWVVVVGLVSALGCGPTSGPGAAPGQETGACIDSRCPAPLVCLSDLCVDPDATPSGDTDHDDMGNPGGGDEPSNPSVSILVVVDNSGSMDAEQAPLSRAIGVLAESLTGAGVDWRIGVTTSDIDNIRCTDTTPEVGRFVLSSCRSRPERFVFDADPPVEAFEDACAAVCPEGVDVIETTPTSIVGSQDVASRPWLQNIGGATNLPPGLAMTDALGCIVPQGIDGCGFEGQLEAVEQALLRVDSPTGHNAGFLPPGAQLVVLIATDEADCSANPAWHTIFSPGGARVFWSDDTAPEPTSAVCWNAGVSCSGSGVYDQCYSIDLDANGDVVDDAPQTRAVLHPLSRYLERLAEIDGAMLALIVGAQSDGSVVYQDALGDAEFQTAFGIGPGCTSANGDAVPPVRMRELAEWVDGQGWANVSSICDESYEEPILELANAIISRLG